MKNDAMKEVAAETPEAPEYSAGQLYRIAAVYDFIARLLPTEGRDFAVKFSFGDDPTATRFNVEFVPYTPIGKVWCNYCREMLGKANRK